MSLDDYKIIFLLVSLTGILILSSPLVLLLVPSQTSEQFSELYLLGPNRTAGDNPVNIEAGLTYTIYLVIANHRGTSSYYLLNVKLRTRNESLPNLTTKMPSSLPAIVEYQIFLADDEIFEKPLNFSLQDITFQGTLCSVKTLSIDGLAYNIDKQFARDQEYAGYFLELFFELWVFDPETRTFSFHNCWTGIWLKVA